MEWTVIGKNEWSFEIFRSCALKLLSKTLGGTVFIISTLYRVIFYYLKEEYEDRI